MLVEGERAPSFGVPATDGTEITEFRLDEFTDTGGVVLLFYPFDFSPVCTEELCEFRDSEWLQMIPELDILGISTDSAYAHKEYIQQNDLPFPLLSDRDGRVSARYDVLYDELEGHPLVSKRAVFLIDDTQTIRYAWEADEWTTDPDISAVNEAATSLDAISLSG